jgi:hypothetical protein
MEKLNSFPPSDDIIRELNDRARELARRIFNDSLEIIADPAATGDQIIDRITRSSPPGFTVRIMGAQNIKGTGLDFAYRWISLDKVTAMIPALESRDERTRMDAIRWFGYYKEYGILDSGLAIDALERAKEFGVNQTAGAQQQIEIAVNYVKAEYEKAIAKLGEAKRSGFLSHIFSIFEQLLDTRDSMKRRKEAKSIIDDLSNGRISHEQASVLLRNLTTRQKGGWLEHDVRGIFR